VLQDSAAQVQDVLAAVFQKVLNAKGPTSIAGRQVWETAPRIRKED
jgi:hypothetical protein